MTIDRRGSRCLQKPAGGKSSEDKCVCSLNKTVYASAFVNKTKGTLLNTHTGGGQRLRMSAKEPRRLIRSRLMLIGSRLTSTATPPPPPPPPPSTSLLQDFSHLFSPSLSTKFRGNAALVRSGANTWPFLQGYESVSVYLVLI